MDIESIAKNGELPFFAYLSHFLDTKLWYNVINKEKRRIDMFDNGFFGNLFDFDGDGKLDAMEQAFDLAAFAQMMEESNKEDDNDD